jgi:hypothetical protein
MLSQHTLANGYIIGVGPTLGQHTFTNGYIIKVGPMLGQNAHANLYNNIIIVGPSLAQLLIAVQIYKGFAQRM